MISQIVRVEKEGPDCNRNFQDGSLNEILLERLIFLELFVGRSELYRFDVFSQPMFERPHNLVEAFGEAVVEFACTEERTDLRHVLQ